MSDCLFTDCIEVVENIQGDVAEFGVLGGLTFIKIASAAAKQNKTAYAFDSFIGMPKAGKHDGDGYPQGRFDQGGINNFIQLMEKHKLQNYKIIEGFIPDTLETQDDLRFSFVYVDIDHYAPTKDLLNWLIPRIPINGLILCDDYFPQREVKILASKAIEEILATELTLEIVKRVNRKLLLRKVK